MAFHSTSSFQHHQFNQPFQDSVHQDSKRWWERNFWIPKLSIFPLQHLALTFREIKNGGRKSKAVNKIPNVLKTKNICQIYDQLVCKFSSNKSSLSSAAGGGVGEGIHLNYSWENYGVSYQQILVISKNARNKLSTISHTWKEVSNNSSQSKTRPCLFWHIPLAM